MNAEIQSDAMSVRELLDGKKYGIDEYQRDYLWQTKHVSDMLEDFESRFLGAWDETHEYEAVASYPQYFLGPMVISAINGERLIVDGQQRITTLTLLLIFLHHLQQDREAQVDVSDLIYSVKYQKKSFNLQVEEREAVLRALYEGEDIDPNGEPESVQNIIARYRDIEELFPESLRDEALPYFIDWLIEKVQVVVITAFTANEAYTIFETMNDRGLSLAPIDMLKGYIVANIDGAEEKKTANHLWREKVFVLHEFDDDADSEFVKAWLRGQHAQDIRSGGKNSTPGDFDRIGTGFHKWVRDNREDLGLIAPADYRDFVHDRFGLYADHYLTMLQASETFTPGLEYVYFNRDLGFTLQYPLMLAAIRPDDDDQTARTKMQLVAGFCDIFIARRAMNFKAMRYSSIRRGMFNLMTDIRRRDVPALADRLKAEVDGMDHDFEGMDRFYLNRFSKVYIKRILARITYYIEQQSGVDTDFETFVSGDVGPRYQIEHIWANHFEEHEDEFEVEERFESYRDRIGGLLLLPKEFNQSFGDLPYEEKLEHYFGQNLLARSLHPKCYERNPGFVRFVKESGLPFRPHEQFKREDLDERQHLYRLLAERIWSTERFEQELET